MHLLRAADVPGVVERAGIAEVEAALLMRERCDVRPGNDGEADQGDERGGNDSREFVFEPDRAVDDEREDAEEREGRRRRIL